MESSEKPAGSSRKKSVLGLKTFHRNGAPEWFAKRHPSDLNPAMTCSDFGRQRPTALA
jgi:hypothetical protein